MWLLVSPRPLNNYLIFNIYLAYALLTRIAAKHLEKVLAPFVAAHIETGVKKDSASELNVRCDPNIDYSYIYTQESPSLLHFCF